MSKIIVKLDRSFSGQPENLRKVIRALGLRKLHHPKEHKDNNCIRGMINKVKHLVTFQIID